MANSLAQLEDAAIESGLDVEFVFHVLLHSYDQGWKWLAMKEDHRETPFRRAFWVRQQMLWDQLQVLQPGWAQARVDSDHAEALGLHLPMAK